ncbi:hypothetical protein ACFSJ3_00190 [Corallincola platygyrae]|uniref:Uncharacterized protein n=1 Tax=Corallincola platygyrae TaxID=1193278 RepID=A0ABW4XH86_9GAMM
MKQLIILAALLGVAYFGFNHFSPKFGSPKVTDPYYVEIRVSYPHESINLVGFGLMHSLQECQAESESIWLKALKHVGKVNVSTDCKKELPAKYQKLFDNKPFDATYITLDPQHESERKGRFVIYGVPSSLMQSRCEALINQTQNQYRGKVNCIKGNVG